MKKLLLISIGALLSISIFSQDVKNLYLFEFEDESEYVGELISDSPDQVTVKRMDGSVVNIPAYKIIKRTKIDEGQWDENAQELIFPNLHDTRYFFSPSAFALNKGEGYYMNAYWLYWSGQVGITDRFSVGFGSTFWLSPSTLAAKYTIPLTEDLTSAVGWFWIGNPFISSEDENVGRFGKKTWVNMPFAVITKGDKEKNITLGIGYNIKSKDDNPFVLNIGGTYRLSRKIAFVVEGWMLTHSYKEERWVENNMGYDDYYYEHKTSLIMFGGPGIRWFRNKTKKRMFGLGLFNKGQGASVIDFQLMFFKVDNVERGDEDDVFEFIGPIPMIGTSTKF